MNAGDLIVVDFPGVQGIKRRPAIVLSSDLYHQARPDVIVGLITSQLASAKSVTDYALQDWQSAGLHSPSAFRSFIVTLPRSAVTAMIGPTTSRDWQGILNSLKSAIASS